MKRLIFLTLLLIVSICSINTFAQNERHIPKVDEASKDPSFKKFRDSLIETVKAKDSQNLLATVSQEIKLRPRGKNGIKTFKKIWKPAKTKSKLWHELTKILMNGGTFKTEAGRKTFCAPHLPIYIFKTYPETPEVFVYHAILVRNVSLREKPSRFSKVTASLSYNVVSTNRRELQRIKKARDGNKWIKVKTMGGKEGFVKAEFVRSSIDYRACFQKIDGNWKLISLVDGY